MDLVFVASPPVEEFWQYISENKRKSRQEHVLSHFDNAYAVAPQDTLRVMFWARDIRGGLGLREVFGWCFEHLSRKNPDVAIKLLPKIPYYGCWRDLLWLIDTPVQQEMFEYYLAALIHDLQNAAQGRPVTLAAKWFPTENGFFDKRFNWLKKFSWHCNIEISQIRKLYITPLRKYITTVDCHCTKRQYKTLSSIVSGIRYKSVK